MAYGSCLLLFVAVALLLLLWDGFGGNGGLDLVGFEIQCGGIIVPNCISHVYNV